MTVLARAFWTVWSLWSFDKDVIYSMELEQSSLESGLKAVALRDSSSRCLQEIWCGSLESTEVVYDDLQSLTELHCFSLYRSNSIAERFRLLRHNTVPWSVCRSITFVYCTQTAEDIDRISFAYDSPIGWSVLYNNNNNNKQIIKINNNKTWLTVTSSSPYFDPPLLTSVGNIRRQIVAECLEIGLE